jgi:hypothetical protein
LYKIGVLSEQLRQSVMFPSHALVQNQMCIGEHGGVEKAGVWSAEEMLVLGE